MTNVSENVFEVSGTIEDDNSNSKSLEILFDVNSFGVGSSTITVDNDIATINEDLGSKTYNQILDLNVNN